jgi:hypothetical protein
MIWMMISEKRSNDATAEESIETRARFEVERVPKPESASAISETVTWPAKHEQDKLVVVVLARRERHDWMRKAKEISWWWSEFAEAVRERVRIQNRCDFV